MTRALSDYFLTLFISLTCCHFRIPCSSYELSCFFCFIKCWLVHKIFRGYFWKEILTSWWSQWLFRYFIQCLTSWPSRMVNYNSTRTTMRFTYDFRIWWSLWYFLWNILLMFFFVCADIQFWNKNKSMEGLSAKSVVVSFICQLIVFLYLLDNDTSWMILASSGIGCCIEFWKIGKAMHIEVWILIKSWDLIKSPSVYLSV